MPWSENIGAACKAESSVALYLAIADEIERKVKEGVLRHGDRIPSTDLIAKQFNVTVPTAQHGLSLLMERGIVKRRPRHGTTIDTSGASRCVCLAVGANPFALESEFDNLILKWLDKAFKRRGIAVDCRISLGGADFKSNIARLADDAEAGRFACLIPLHASMDLMNWLMARRKLRWSWPAHVDMKDGAFKAVDALLSKGFRRIASISRYPSDYYPEPAMNQEFEGVWEAYRKHGLPAPASPLLYWGRDQTQTEKDGYEGVKSLMADPVARPDALFINHDILANGAFKALKEIGASVPEDIAVATHSNKGASYAWPEKVLRLEYDLEEIAEATAKHIDENLLSSRTGEQQEPPMLKGVLIEGKA